MALNALWTLQQKLVSLSYNQNNFALQMYVCHYAFVPCKTVDEFGQSLRSTSTRNVAIANTSRSASHKKQNARASLGLTPYECPSEIRYLPKDQLSQRGRATLRVVENFAKIRSRSSKIIPLSKACVSS